MQLPDEQVDPCGQTVPHAPQLLLSVFVFTHLLTLAIGDDPDGHIAIPKDDEQLSNCCGVIDEQVLVLTFTQAIVKVPLVWLGVQTLFKPFRVYEYPASAGSDGSRLASYPVHLYLEILAGSQTGGVMLYSAKFTY